MQFTYVRIVCTAIAVLFPVLVHAESLVITPTLVDASEGVEQTLRESAGFARETFDGRGSRFTFEYSAAKPFDVYAIPLKKDKTYDSPLGMVTFEVPATIGEERNRITVDLSRSPSWSPMREKYLMIFLSREEGTNAAFYDYEFSGPSPIELASIMMRHLFIPEPYVPASYHVLRGYRILNGSFAILLGVVTVIAAMTFTAWKRSPRIVLLVLISGALLYNARFSIDLLRITHEHLSSWYTQGLYDEARGVYSVAEHLRGNKDMIVRVCRDGTNYREKLLRYFAYPTPIISDDDNRDPTHILIMSKRRWSFEDGILTCGDIVSNAKLAKEYIDDSRLFTLLP